MLSIKKILLSLALVAVASTQTTPLVSAALTKFDAKYDGMAMYILDSLAGLAEVVESIDDAEIKKQFATVQKKTKEMAAAGTLTGAEYSCLVDKFYTKANKKYKNFADYAQQVLDNDDAHTGQFIANAPTYWYDFITIQMNLVADSFDNKDLISLIEAFDTQTEKAITDKAKTEAILKLLNTFLDKAVKLEPTYRTAVTKRIGEQLSSIVNSFNANAGCDGTATPSPTTAKPSSTTAKPSATTAKPSVTTTEPAATTEAPVKEAVEVEKNETATAAPAKAKSNTTATTTAPPAKSSATTYVAGAASVLAMAAVVVFTTVL